MASGMTLRSPGEAPNEPQCRVGHLAPAAVDRWRVSAIRHLDDLGHTASSRVDDVPYQKFGGAYISSAEIAARVVRLRDWLAPGGLRLYATSRLSCGSSASRRPSPRKLKHRSVIESANPGKITSHGNSASSRAPSETSVPHDAAGGWTPRPRNERNASCRITAGTVGRRVDITRARRIGD